MNISAQMIGQVGRVLSLRSVRIRYRLLRIRRNLDSRIQDKHIFIAGCARSGTSLTRGLMGCFQDVYAHGGFSDGHEKSISGFVKFSRPGTHIVIKRTAMCYQSLGKLPADIDLLYCVRHPFDTLTSPHRWTQHIRPFHVTPERWLAEYNALRFLRARQPNRQIFVLRYEDLIARPDECQRRIAHHFGLACRYRFSENPEGVRLHADSVAKWQRNPTLLSYITSLDDAFMSEIRRFCVEFGYDVS